ncbi:MAG: diaminobutyrate acetyltransferase [Myxococcota bacterium]
MTVTLRHPTPEDAPAVWNLVRRSTLDDNSAYAYAILFLHHARACAVAVADDHVAGFVLGYRVPDRPDTQFVWQIGVDADFRGQGIGGRLLRWLASEADAEQPVRWVEATVTADNAASRALFRGLARDLGTACEVEPCLSAEVLADHPAEDLFRIGPIAPETSP